MITPHQIELVGRHLSKRRSLRERLGVPCIPHPGNGQPSSASGAHAVIVSEWAGDRVGTALQLATPIRPLLPQLRDHRKQAQVQTATTLGARPLRAVEARIRIS